MSEQSVDPNGTLEIYPVAGETIALWVPLSLALLGTILSILIAQSLLSEKEMEPSTINEFSATEPITTHKNLKGRPISSASAESEKTEPIKMMDCPPLFFFTFSKDSAIPRTHDLMPQIDRLNQWLVQHPDKKIYIEGHTDSSGTEEYNLLLSYRRAKAAEKILTEAGIAKNQLITRALGELEPLEDQPAESEQNRRASIRVEDLEECIDPMIDGESS